MKASTIETLFQYEEVLCAFAKNIGDKYETDFLGDDWWIAFPLDQDRFADINVWISETNKKYVLKISAYPVDADGFTVCDEWLSLYKRTLKKTKNKFSIRKLIK